MDPEYRRHQDTPLFKIGDDVILNEMGVDCWNRNREEKSITHPKTLLTVIGIAGFDNGKWIIKVQDAPLGALRDGNVDYYFEDCLVKFNLLRRC